MSLTGHYGAAPRRAAERMVDEGVYFAACSDSHRPHHVDTVARGLEALTAHVGAEEVAELLVNGPRQLLDGTAEY